MQQRAQKKYTAVLRSGQGQWKAMHKEKERESRRNPLIMPSDELPKQLNFEMDEQPQRPAAKRPKYDLHMY